MQKECNVKVLTRRSISHDAELLVLKRDPMKKIVAVQVEASTSSR
jgi:hypothetical protein